MKNTMGIIMTTKSDKILKGLTKDRSMAAVPFGGRYRLIDFPLSNMVNAGIVNIGIIVSHKFRALTDHLGSGKEWGLNKKNEGLFILPSDSPGILNKTLRIDLKDIYVNIDYIERSFEKYVVIAGVNIIHSIDLKELISNHIQKESDITLTYKVVDRNEEIYSDCAFIDINDQDRVIRIDKDNDSWDMDKLSLEVCILERELLLEILEVAVKSGIWDFEDLLNRNMEELKVYGYEHEGYVANINSLDNYYKYSKGLLDPNIQQELFFKNGKIRTKTKDGPPTNYRSSSTIKNALVSSGCLIEGTLESSLLSRNVKIGENSLVRNSIIMQSCHIEENVVLENVILDKNVHVTKGKVLKGSENNIILIGKNTVI
ncbi:glucose-1-phosphate adenylyltransferase [Desulfonispora thiosulfatigenes DSM 11270]|uniref:Glucose-1-phosphate adenylyltransferase n=1 Tax=Desulfonispora thiosulfatigenes DSM 11270 TaxID=656914 RepID=A0A1W1VLQ5_DESTI|nr:glucose-1-phosphate adenylyltransferase subunit GlgD [Desulfonispora thiosulfatigenes]SMB94315.1 glucose-1-phosphate adenylyltransferase [Desulfonispora thiosulfatigenes DSM 11270]